MVIIITKKRENVDISEENFVAQRSLAYELGSELCNITIADRGHRFADVGLTFIVLDFVEAFGLPRERWDNRG